MIAIKYRAALAAASLLLLLAACGGSGSGGGGSISGGPTPADAGGSGGGIPTTGETDNGTMFSLLSHSPGTDSINQSLVTTIVLNFDRALLSETVTAAAIYVERAGVRETTSIDYSAGTTQVQLNFTQPLAPSSRYTVVIGSELMAEDGSIFVAQSWYFDTAANIGLTAQAVIDQCMSQTDIAMLAAVNEARLQARSCGTTTSPEVATVAWSCTLENAALGHSQDMAENNFFAHTGSDGLGLGDRVSNAGYLWRSVSENIAAGQTSLEQVMSSWLTSPGHCLNIMSSSVTELGAARVSSSTASYSDYWTQNFAQP